MRSFFVIVITSIAETVRDRILWSYSIIAVLLMLGLFAIAKVPWGETHYVIGQLGYSAIALVSQVLAALLAAFQFGRDAERRVNYMILGRDIRRSVYVAGKFTGLWITCSVLGAVLTAMLFGLTSYEAAYRAPMWSLWAAVPLLMLQTGVVLAAATLLYHATTSTTLSMVLSLLVVAIGRSIASVQAVLANLNDFAKHLAGFGAYLVPNLELLQFNDFVIYEMVPDARSVAVAVVYAVAYMTAAVALAMAVYSRKEL